MIAKTVAVLALAGSAAAFSPSVRNMHHPCTLDAGGVGRYARRQGRVDAADMAARDSGIPVLSFLSYGGDKMVSISGGCGVRAIDDGTSLSVEHMRSRNVPWLQGIPGQRLVTSYLFPNQSQM